MVVKWKPSAALSGQVDRILRLHSLRTIDESKPILEEVDRRAGREGNAQTQTHMVRLRSVWDGLLEKHYRELVVAIVQLLERMGVWGGQTVEWVLFKAEKQLDGMASGVASAHADRAARWKVEDLGAEQSARLLSRLKARVREEAESASAEADLVRQRQTPGPEASTAPLALDNFHPRVVEVAGALYRDGHYREAILNAYIALIEAVKTRAGRADLDGTELMMKVFSPKKRELSVSDEDSDQQGFMFLFAGAVLGIRNPKAHRMVQQHDPQRALEWLAFASVLFRVLDEARAPELGA